VINQNSSREKEMSLRFSINKLDIFRKAANPKKKQSKKATARKSFNADNTHMFDCLTPSSSSDTPSYKLDNFTKKDSSFLPKL
jgi:hypothetical protein